MLRCIKCTIGRLPICCPIWSFNLHVCVLFVIFIIKLFQKEEDLFIDFWSFFIDLLRSLETADTAKSSVVEEKSKLVSFASWIFNLVTNYYSFTECANPPWIIWFLFPYYRTVCLLVKDLAAMQYVVLFHTRQTWCYVKLFCSIVEMIYYNIIYNNRYSVYSSRSFKLRIWSRIPVTAQNS